MEKPREENPFDLVDRPFILTSFQQDAVDQIMEHYMSGIPAQWLAADRGYGKTYVGSELARILYETYGMRPLIISPAGVVQETWQKMMKDLGIPAWGYVTWNALVGKRGKVLSGKGTGEEKRAAPKLSHPWLVRENEEHGPFKATVEFQNACREGLYLICDESQAVKNDDSGRHWALSELVQHGLACDGSKFFILHLTALFLEKEKSYSCLYRVLGCTNGQNKMFEMNHRTRVQEWVDYGFGGVVEQAARFDRVTTYAIMASCFPVNNVPKGTKEDYKYRITKKEMEKALRLLWEQVLIHHYQPRTEDVVHKNRDGVPFKFVKRNGFFPLEPEEAAECAEAISALKKAHVIQGDQINVKNARDQMAFVQSQLMKLTHAKTPAFLRRIVSRLKADPTCKVIAVFPFIDDQNWLLKNLKMYGAVQINGKVTFEQRSSNIKLFNEPNLKCRVIIISPAAGGIGVSLHDHVEPTVEDYLGLKHLFDAPDLCIFPRKIEAISTFDYMAMFQAYGRAYRTGMRSDVELTVFFASNVPIESILVNTMMKSQIAKNSITAKNREFPDEFEIYIENENESHAELRSMLEKMRAMAVDELKNATK